MDKKTLIILIVILIILSILGIIIWKEIFKQKYEGYVLPPNFEEAKQKCIEEGLRVEHKTENMGTWTAGYDVCIFDDGSECDSLQYLGEKCAMSQYKNWSMLHPIKF